MQSHKKSISEMYIASPLCLCHVTVMCLPIPGIRYIDFSTHRHSASVNLSGNWCNFAGFLWSVVSDDEYVWRHQPNIDN